MTRLFDNLPSTDRDARLAANPDLQDELPVIGSFQDSFTWLLLTTKRLIASIDDKQLELSVNLIRDAVVDFEELQRNGENKTTMRHLIVVTMDDYEHLIEMEPGNPLSGLWHVLKNIGTRNRH